MSKKNTDHKKKSAIKKQPSNVALPEKAVAKLTIARNHVSTGNLHQALLCYEDLLSKYPRTADIYFELGSLYFQKGEVPQAVTLWKKTIKLQPTHVNAHCNLAVAVWQLNGIETASPYFEKAIQISPEHIDTIYNFAGLLLQSSKCKAAIGWFEKILALQPRHADSWMYKGNAHFERGEFPLAKQCYQKVVDLNPSGGAKVRLAAAIPMIADSNEHIKKIRNDFMNRLQQLIDDKIKTADPVKENGYTNFFLAYHGLDDLPLQKKYAELYEKACPALLYESPNIRVKSTQAHSGKIRIGFISKYLKGHSIGKTSYGIIKNLDRTVFDVVVIALGPPTDQMAQTILAAADETLTLPNDLAHARHLIEQKQLDILYYQDIGMDPFTYFLAFSRLAQVQCASFGHPVTSGIKNIDYHISTELWEPEDGDSHYCEKLIRLRDVASVAYYLKPKQPENFKPREYFNLPEDANIYICSQNLFKFHPDFDFIMAGILRADKKGLIVLIEGLHKPWADILRRRFKHTIPDVANRIKFAERQFGEDYISLLATADVMLDTIHFCGFNTTLEGFSVGLPVVTLPGKFMRSRHTAAFYKKIGYTRCVAKDFEQYIEIAVRLAIDSKYKQETVSNIQKHLDELWEDDNVIQEFERFFKEVITQ